MLQSINVRHIDLYGGESSTPWLESTINLLSCSDVVTQTVECETRKRMREIVVREGKPLCGHDGGVHRRDVQFSKRLATQNILFVAIRRVAMGCRSLRKSLHDGNGDCAGASSVIVNGVTIGRLYLITVSLTSP